MVKAPMPVQRNPVTWIVVADGRQARIFMPRHVERHIPMSGNARHHHYQERHELELQPVFARPLHAESVDRYDFGRDQLGRVFESASTARHMAEPRIDVRQEIKADFMKSVARELEKARGRNAFDRLVLVAPPKTLGELKKHLGQSLQACVVSTLAKDLTHYQNHELVRQLEEVL
jgi:protein required for attachment to host cells